MPPDVNEASENDVSAAREGYRAAIQLVAHQSKVIWDSFRSLLGVNTVFASLCGALIKIYPDYRDLTRIVASSGILVSIAWVLITARAYDQYAYWFAWARRYEGAALGGANHMIQCGKEFSRGKKVAEVELQMRVGSRLFKVEWLNYVAVATFIAIYVYVLRRA
jgi:hypothetical protein